MIAFNSFKSVKRLLVLGAHSDDIEIGAGATVLRILREAPVVEVTWCVFSGSEARHTEARASAELFLKGAVTKSLVLTSFQDAFFPAQLTDIKREFENLKSFDPDLILTHTRDDRHQDHRVVSDLTWNTFRNHQIWEYEIPKWDGDLIAPNLYVPVEPADVDEKVHALMTAFGSQRRSIGSTKRLFVASCGFAGSRATRATAKHSSRESSWWGRDRSSQRLRGKRVFVTGHTGFKGPWLLALLDQLGATTLGYALPPETSPSMLRSSAANGCANTLSAICATVIC